MKTQSILRADDPAGEFAENNVERKEQRFGVIFKGIRKLEKPFAVHAQLHLGKIAVAVFHAEDEAGESPLIVGTHCADEIGNCRPCHDHYSNGDDPYPFFVFHFSHKDLNAESAESAEISF